MGEYTYDLYGRKRKSFFMSDSSIHLVKMCVLCDEQNRFWEVWGTCWLNECFVSVVLSKSFISIPNRPTLTTYHKSPHSHISLNLMHVRSPTTQYVLIRPKNRKGNKRKKKRRKKNELTFNAVLLSFFFSHPFLMRAKNQMMVQMMFDTFSVHSRWAFVRGNEIRPFSLLILISIYFICKMINDELCWHVFKYVDSTHQPKLSEKKKNRIWNWLHLIMV